MHFYEKNIVEIKNEYTKFLINLMRPFIYEGFTAIYLEANKIERGYAEKEKINPKVKNPGIFKIFQSLLRDVQNLNDNFIEDETKRIKERGKCSEFFDDLVRAVVKSFIVLLTYNASEKKCQIVKEKFHESVNIRQFIHKCYIECARIFFNHPELFWHKFPPMETKKNQREAYIMIGEGIVEAIRKMLPVRLILEEYLAKDYIESSESQKNSESEKNNKNKTKFTTVKNLVRRDLYGKGLNAFQEEEDDGQNQSSLTEKSNKDKNSVSSNGIIDSDEDSNSEGESLHEIGNKANNLDFDNLVLANHENKKEENTGPSLIEKSSEKNKKSENKQLVGTNTPKLPTNNPTNLIGELTNKQNNGSISENKKVVLQQNIPDAKQSEVKSEVKPEIKQPETKPDKNIKEVTINSKDKDNFFNNLMKT